MTESDINTFLDQISTIEKNVLIMRFGLDGGNVHTLEEVGKEFSLTREEIRLIELKALNILKGFNKNDQQEKLEQILLSIF